MEEVGTCCFCGQECNWMSQSCGRCARKVTGALLGFGSTINFDRIPEGAPCLSWYPRPDWILEIALRHYDGAVDKFEVDSQDCVVIWENDLNVYKHLVDTDRLDVYYVVNMPDGSRIRFVKY